MITRQDLVHDRGLCIAKSSGALIGLAVGDALGDAGRDAEFRDRFGLVTSLPDGVQSTDDTEFALLTARTLVDCDGELTSETVLQSWRKYIVEQGGVYDRAGRPLYGAVENIKRGTLPPYSGIDNVLNNDDGAAMRVAPIGVVCAGEPKRAARLAEIDAQISHHADGIRAAQAVAASIAVAMVDGTPEEVIEAGIQQIPTDSWLGRAMARAMRICEQTPQIEQAWEPLHTELWTPVHSAAAEAIPQTYALLRLTDVDFRKGLFWSANFGRDADTITALVGAIAGAKQGISVIPDRWTELVRKPGGVCLKFATQEDILVLARELTKLIR